jgi:hypothetical protein
MSEENIENSSDQNDGILKISGLDDSLSGDKPEAEKYQELNYGDIIIMIWRRVKFNERISAQLRR